MNKMNQLNLISFLIKTLQGSLIGLGAVLPGISGGVLCVIFGIYQSIMEFLADPLHTYKTHIPQLFPIILGGAIGFLGIANILSFFLERYPAPSVCLFIGLIGGMLPSLFQEAEAKGESRASYIAMYTAMAVVFVLLIALRLYSVEIAPSYMWYIFCGFCLALSVIVPGMSFSTLLMPLGLYEPFVSGIGRMDLAIVVPGGIGALVTVILLSQVVNALFARHYSVAFHAIIGIVLAATVVIIPFHSFMVSVASFFTNILCIVFGCVASLLLSRLQSPAKAEKQITH